MIRINLLPFRAARKKENIRRQISVFVLSVVCLALLMGFVFLNLSRNVAALETDMSSKKKELATYAETTKKIEELKKKITEVRAKLNVIKELESKKTGPVLLLDELSMAVPKEKLWLTDLNEKNGILTLKGTAMDNDTVALFMTNLENAKHVVSVDLQTAKLNNLPKYKLNVVDFVLICKTYAHKEKAKPETKKKR
ncbi:MAG: PilN domain-containing protein [Proteobacteria bacterium]|nr:PilN domain-containing protein [Pseudomonadota bacterium]